MRFIEVKNGKAYYCEVALKRSGTYFECNGVVQDSIAIGGTFTIDGGDIRLKLVRFDDPFEVPDDAQIEVRTEENWIASLFDIVPTGGGQYGYGEKAAYKKIVLVNTALIGWKPWSQEDRVRRTQFRVPPADLLLRHWPTYKALINNRFREETERVAFDVPITGGRVRVYYSTSGSIESDYPRDVWPVIEMEFDEGITLSVLRKQTITMLQFLSASMSMRLAAREQAVSPLSDAEWISEIEKGKYPHDYSLYYYEADIERAEASGRGGLHGGFTLLDDDDERRAFIACLQTWFARDSDWAGAAAALMGAFLLDDVMSPERLLNATKWIEATPGTEPRRVMSETHVLALSKLVSRNAVSFGYGAVTGRLRNSLRQIASEQNVRRFARLVADLKAFYGDQMVGDDLAEWVAEAFSWRGRAAHRPIIGQTEDEYKRFAKATHAAECFAYLMLLRDLPMSGKGKERVAHAPLVAAYRLGIKGHRPREIR